jgi:predicted enzyme related to lactoylglutathione lyase
MVTMFWLGEVFSIECLPGGGARPEYTDRTQVPMIPVIRSHAVGGVIDRLQAAGVRFINDLTQHNYRIAYFVDPSGSVTGVQERFPESMRAPDHEAKRRWEAGTTTIPDVPPMPADLHALGWVIMRVADVGRETAFYRDVIGLDVIEDGGRETWLSLNETAVLGLLPGGAPAPIPADRSEVNDTFILRVQDIDGIVADLRAQGVRFVNEPFDIPGGRLAYLADPEGRTIGIQQRFPSSDRAEDAEAARRWANR